MILSVSLPAVVKLRGLSEARDSLTLSSIHPHYIEDG